VKVSGIKYVKIAYLFVYSAQLKSETKTATALKFETFFFQFSRPPMKLFYLSLVSLLF